MTREALIKHWDVIQAFKDGKIIEYRRVGVENWSLNKDQNHDFSENYEYRVKPESTKRLPTIEDVKEWFLENKVFMRKTQPQLYRIECISIDDEIVRIGEVNITIKRLCEDFTNYDGSELYITE